MGSVPSHREMVTMDACLSGWGVVWQSRTAQGHWSIQEHTLHVNVLELRAVHLALKHFLPFLRGRHVLVQSDNMLTVADKPPGRHQVCTVAVGSSGSLDLGSFPPGQPLDNVFARGVERDGRLSLTSL